MYQYSNFSQNNYQTPESKPKRRIWPKTALIVLVGVAAWWGLRNFSVLNNVTSSVRKTSHAAAAVQKPKDTTSMQATINQVIAANPNMQIAVSVTDLNTDKAYHYGESDSFIAASTAKLITASLFLHEVEQGNYDLSTTINGNTAQYELQQLIEQSDNDAWVAFNETLGHQELLDWANSIGLSNYDPDTNVLTSDDIALLLAKLYQNKLLNSSDTKLLLSYMKSANETQFIESSVPDGVNVYHKTGMLSDRVHDAAIIDDGKNPYILVIFTKTDGDYDTSVGQQIFHQITDATVKTFIK